jgi:hypothetical protein
MKISTLILVSVALAISACKGNTGAQGGMGIQGPAGPAVPTPTPTPATAVQTIVDGYNQYLVSIGNDPIEPGLKCTLYTVPNMPASPCILAADVSGCTKISKTHGYALVESFTYSGTIDQADQAGSAGFNMLPANLQALYSSNFALTCTGFMVNTDYAYHSFSTSSDDGSLLYVGGTLVVKNDGLHALATVSGEKYLEPQVYSFQLNYFQGPGNVALIVNMDGSLLPSANLYH